MRDASITWLRQSRIGLRAGVTALRAWVAALLLASACALSGCASGGATGGAFAGGSFASGSFANTSFAMAGDNPTIAFESIDGPPPQVFDRMVSVLDSETKLRSLQIVSRENPAAFRVRSYLSAQVVRGRTMIAWVWDVYDREQQRALRLSGEEPAGKAGRDPWTAADDLVLRKIAQAGLSGLASMINGTPPEASPPAGPSRRGPAVASAELPSPAPSGTRVSALGYTDR
jgi:hypothetical protein